MNNLSRRIFAAAFVFGAGGFGLATTVVASPPTTENAAIAVPEITVLGDSDKTSPLDFVPTVSELSGARLSRRQKSTLGETLSRETGVNSSQFGPNASRPVIRGLDGERIRVLQNGTGVLDASAASPDHSIALDPLVVERIEIVRGSSALLYGSSAVGGVVNVVTRRIPETKIDFIRGAFESRLTSVDKGRSMGFAIDGPISESKAWQFHLDGGGRAADDYETPVGTVTNSFNRTWNGAVGTSYVGEDGFAGVSFANYDSQYGTVAEKAVNIDMKQRRFDFSGGAKNLGWFDSVKIKSTLSAYQHEEIENGKVGTTFKNRGTESRVDFKQKPVGIIEGFIGLQVNTFTFEALGDEAFLPLTNNTSLAAFLFQEAKIGRFTPSVGFRVDGISVASEVAPEKAATFGASETKSFTAASASLGLGYALTNIHSLVLNASYTERAPNYQELFANGKHVATEAFEVGDKTLAKEQSRALELSWRAKSDEAKGSLGVFVQDFQNFIALAPTGNNDVGSGLPIFNYAAVEARLIGAEAEYRYALPDLIPGGVLEMELKADYVRGFDRRTGLSLPRIPALRETLGLLYKADAYQVDFEIQRTERQNTLALNETETAAYTFVNFGVETPIHLEGFTLNLGLRATNLFDVEARNHVSILKSVAPLAGRSFNFVLQASF